MDAHENLWAARTCFQEEETSWHIKSHKSCIGSRSAQSEQELWVGGGALRGTPRKWWAHLNKETADCYLEKQTGRKTVAAHSDRTEGQSSSGTNMLFPNWVGWGGGQGCQDFPLTRWIPGKVTELEPGSKTSPQRAAGKAKCQGLALSWGWGSWIRNIERNTRRVGVSTFANSRNKQLDYEIRLRKTFSRPSGEARVVSGELEHQAWEDRCQPPLHCRFQGFRESLSFQAEMSEQEERGRFCLDQSGIFTVWECDCSNNQGWPGKLWDWFKVYLGGREGEHVESVWR